MYYLPVDFGEKLEDKTFANEIYFRSIDELKERRARIWNVLCNRACGRRENGRYEQSFSNEITALLVVIITNHC